MNTVVFDVESVALGDAGDYLEPATAPSNYRDEAKIAAYIEQANSEALARAALDVDLARIVAIGVSIDGGPVEVALAHDDESERDILAYFWSLVRQHPLLIGFNCLGFDLPLLLRRSLYLGVPTPRLPLNKYRHDGISDLMLDLSFDGALKYRGLAFYRRRFALDVPEDPHTGADIARLVAEDDWDAVRAHCACDVRATAALARRLGLLSEGVL